MTPTIREDSISVSAKRSEREDLEVCSCMIHGSARPFPLTDTLVRPLFQGVI